MTTIDNGSIRKCLTIAIAYIIETREKMGKPPYMALIYL